MIRNHEDRVTLIGRLGSAPETKPTANGEMLILSLGVQVISWTTGEAGETQTSERTSWHRVVSFIPRVIRQGQELEKDDTVAVRGYLDQRTYKKDGEDVFITEFVAEELDPLRTKRQRTTVLNFPPVDRSTAKRADMLRVTVELLPGGREGGAVVISHGTSPCVEHDRWQIEFLDQLGRPLLPDGSRADNQQPPFALRPSLAEDNARFDGFAKPDLIRKDHAF